MTIDMDYEVEHYNEAEADYEWEATEEEAVDG